MDKRLYRLIALLALLSAFCQCTPQPETDPSDPGTGTEQPGGSGTGENPSSTWLDVNPASLTVSHESQNKMVYLLTNAPDGWSIECSTDEWISITVNWDHIIVHFDENEGNEARTAEIVVSAADVKKTIPIIQNSRYGGDFELIQGEGYSYVLNDNSVMLPAEYIKYLDNVDLEHHLFHVPAEYADKITIVPGTQVVINAITEKFPEGLLARIQDVIPSDDGGYDVSYSTAHLLDCFRDLDVSECDVDLSGHVQKVVDKDGNEIDFKATKSITTEKLHIVIPQVDIDLPLGCSITPKMEADITMKTQIKAENYTLSTLNIIMDADCTLGADISASLDLKTMNYMPRQKVCSIIFGAIPVGPLVITPTLDLYTNVSIGLTTKLEASVSYKRSFRAHVHYDEVTGLEMSSKLYDEEPNALKLEIGPKLEGSVTYGLGIGPGISFYGGALGVGVSIDPCITESVSAKFDIMDTKSYQSTRKGSALSFLGINPTYDYAYELSAGAHLYGIGFGFSANTPSIKFPVRSCPIAPKLADDFEVTSDGSEAILRTKVTGGQSLFYGPLVALLYNADNPENRSDYISVGFDFDQEKYEQLAETDEVEIIAKTPIDPGKKYNVDIFTEIEGVTVMLRTYYPQIQGVDKRASAAVRAILRDIRSSAAGEWEGCNWDNAYVMVGDYKNVVFSPSYPNRDKFYLKITIPEEWKLSGDLKIGKHTEGLEDIIDEWDIDIEGDDRHFSSVEIDDPLLSQFFISDHVDKFTLHSDICPAYTTSLPQYVKELDLSRCLSISKELYYEQKYLPNLKKIVLDSCPVKKIHLTGISGKNIAMPELQAKDVELENLWINDHNITDVDLTKIESIDKLALYSCGGRLNGRCNAVSIAIDYGTFDEMNISDCPSMNKLSVYSVNTPSVVVANNPKVERVDIYQRTSERPQNSIGSLSISNCPSATRIDCWDVGISSLELLDLPSLSYLECEGNRNLTGIMLPIFDEMIARKATVIYDQRYTNYRWDYDAGGYTCDDNGYGFYYEGEPERGYHRK